MRPSPGEYPSRPAAGVVDCHPKQTATAKGDPGKRSFEMLMTPLQPNRYYCFQFTTLSDITDPTEKARVEAAVDTAITSVMNQNFWLNRPTFSRPSRSVNCARACSLLLRRASDRARSSWWSRVPFLTRPSP